MKKIIFLFSIFLFFEMISAGQVQAGTDDNVWGWAWSENIGWISFNSTTGGGSVDYGVNIGTDGVFSGYAWSENIGWISFNEADLVGCPSGTCQAKINLTSGEVSGWARALSHGDSWDGWIHLRGSSYRVSIDFSTSPKDFEGWAWGGDVIGWISFNSENCDPDNDGLTEGGANNPNYPQCPDGQQIADYKVQTTFSRPPTATLFPVEPKNYCTNPVQYFSWQFQDPDPGDTQGAYQLQVDKEGDFLSFGPGEFDSGKVYSSIQNIQVVVAKNPGSNQLGYNTHYYWRLKVWDEYGAASDWIYGSAFDTEIHMYPDPDFTWIPSLPSQGEFVQFCSTCNDESTCYDINNKEISCSGKNFLWSFSPDTVEYATGTSPTSENPRVKFLSQESYTATLQITDDVGTCTSLPKEIGVTLPLPEWREISP